MPITVRYDVPAALAGGAAYETGSSLQRAKRLAEQEERAYRERQAAIQRSQQLQDREDERKYLEQQQKAQTEAARRNRFDEMEYSALLSGAAREEEAKQKMAELKMQMELGLDKASLERLKADERKGLEEFKQGAIGSRLDTRLQADTEKQAYSALQARVSDSRKLEAKLAVMPLRNQKLMERDREISDTIKRIKAYDGYPQNPKAVQDVEDLLHEQIFLRTTDQEAVDAEARRLANEQTAARTANITEGTAEKIREAEDKKREANAKAIAEWDKDRRKFAIEYKTTNPTAPELTEEDYIAVLGPRPDPYDFIGPPITAAQPPTGPAQVAPPVPVAKKPAQIKLNSYLWNAPK